MTCIRVLVVVGTMSVLSLLVDRLLSIPFKYVLSVALATKSDLLFEKVIPLLTRPSVAVE